MQNPKKVYAATMEIFIILEDRAESEGRRAKGGERRAESEGQSAESKVGLVKDLYFNK
jgi:hypothetical protein